MQTWMLRNRILQSFRGYFLTFHTILLSLVTVLVGLGADDRLASYYYSFVALAVCVLGGMLVRKWEKSVADCKVDDQWCRVLVLLAERPDQSPSTAGGPFDVTNGLQTAFFHWHALSVTDREKHIKKSVELTGIDFGLTGKRGFVDGHMPMVFFLSFWFLGATTLLSLIYQIRNSI
ncbi:MAG: hypothetical protein AAF682_32525 [Planctomycetota bacterium]